MLPIGADVGDKIVVLNGGTFPPEGGNFKVPGPCYVHGIMDGETVVEGPGVRCSGMVLALLEARYCG